MTPSQHSGPEPEIPGMAPPPPPETSPQPSALTPPPEEESAAKPAVEVKYSLRELLREVEVERSQSTLAKEIVDQEEIGKLFKNRKRRVRSKTQ